MIERIEHQGTLIALIVRVSFNEPGVHFLTPNDFSQQLGYMRHPAGKKILPHYHVLHQRQVHRTQEVLVLRRGKLRVDFYGIDLSYLGSRVLEAGDIVLLATGGHGFEVLEEIEMVEIKQGPYVGNEDKVRFDPFAPAKVPVE